MAPVEDLVDVATACARREPVNVVGVVVDQMSAMSTRGGSFCITFEIKDEHFDDRAWENSLKVRYFADNESHLPHVLLNDVVLFRNIRITNYQNRPHGVVGQNQKVSWAIFRPEIDASKDPAITTGPNEFSPTSTEKKKALELLDKAAPFLQLPLARSSRRSDLPAPSSTVIEASISSKKSQFTNVTLIKDLQPDRFCRVVGQVVKDHHYEGDKSTIWITDYTEQGDLPDHEKDGEDTGSHGDPYGHLSNKKQWPGPWGRFTLQVTLWDPHATFARKNVKIGDIVLLTYVRPKFSSYGGLEAAVHEDKRFQRNIHIQTVSPDYDKDAQELMKRRKEYWKIHGTKKEETRPAKKQRKFQEKAKEQRKEEGQTALPVKAAATAPKTQQNPNVKPREYGVTETSVDSLLSAETHIISLPGGVSYKVPFQNVCYALVVRVVDFYPPKLEDFAVQVQSTSIVDRDSEHMAWDWRFCLLVEGVEPLMSKNQQRERVKIFVSGAEAEHLLCLDATNLHLDSDRLDELREKLAILWGDLEEKKRGEPKDIKGKPWAPVKCSNLPFKCCIKEYGVPCRHSEDTDAMAIDEQLCVQKDCFGWERRFSLYATTIHDQSK
ncbi:hypothetical protein N7478_004491 [Penicillium angulare]|uniref:uncharacterized protein n=1 Tax=Penicillium angulare TaxID=116970 RepID=UPI0025414806|nr:uncharacterized protein N7478_004491 [Penicillium angulare]KAJ5279119.1 hypothetical protein N7478_004491 [Penicillium angulare]